MQQTGLIKGLGSSLDFGLSDFRWVVLFLWTPVLVCPMGRISVWTQELLLKLVNMSKIFDIMPVCEISFQNDV